MSDVFWGFQTLNFYKIKIFILDRAKQFKTLTNDPHPLSSHFRRLIVPHFLRGGS